MLAALALLPALVSILALRAEGQGGEGTGGAAREVEAVYLELLPAADRFIVRLDDGNAYRLAAAAAPRHVEVIESLVRKGDRLRLALDETGDVTNLEPLGRAPSGFGKERIARVREVCAGLKRGDEVQIERASYTVDLVTSDVLTLRYDFNNQRGWAHFRIDEIPNIHVVKRAEETAPPPGTAEPPPGPGQRPAAAGNLPELVYGDWIEVRGNIRGMVYEIEQGVSFTVVDADREKHKFPWGTPRKHIPREAIAVDKGKPTQKAVAPAVGSAVPVDIHYDRGSLDGVSNKWELRGALRHSVPNVLIVDARLDIEAKGEGRMLPASLEDKVIAAVGPDVIDAGEPFLFDGITHVVHKASNEVVIYVPEGRFVEEADTVIVETVFPDVPEPFRYSSRLYAPEFKARLAFDAARNQVPYEDERAVVPLVRAYLVRGEATRRAALAAMARNRDERLVPFLLHQYYYERGEAAETVKRALTAFGEVAERYLVMFVRDREDKVPLKLLQESGEVRPTRVVDPDALLSRAVECLAALKSRSAMQPVFALAGSESAEVREAVTAFFIELGSQSVHFLAHQLVIGRGRHAQPLVLEIERAEAGTLRRILEELKVAPEFFQELAGVPQDEGNLRMIAKIKQELSGGLEGPAAPIIEGTLAYEKVKDLRQALEQLRKDASRSYVARSLGTPPEGVDARWWQAEMARWALVLDTVNPTAQSRLGDIYYEVAIEMKQGAGLRAGPSEEYRRLRLLAEGERLVRAVPRADMPPGGPEWVPVQRLEGGVGYVHASVLRVEGSDAVRVWSRTRPFEDLERLFEMSRTLSPGRAADCDREIARLYAERAAAREAKGDWQGAFEDWRHATAVLGSAAEYWQQLLMAYLRANLALAALAAALAIALPVAVLMLRRRSGPTSGGAPWRRLEGARSGGDRPLESSLGATAWMAAAKPKTPPPPSGSSSAGRPAEKPEPAARP